MIVLLLIANSERTNNSRTIILRCRVRNTQTIAINLFPCISYLNVTFTMKETVVIALGFFLPGSLYNKMFCIYWYTSTVCSHLFNFTVRTLCPHLRIYTSTGETHIHCVCSCFSLYCVTVGIYCGLWPQLLFLTPSACTLVGLPHLSGVRMYYALCTRYIREHHLCEFERIGGLHVRVCMSTYLGMRAQSHPLMAHCFGRVWLLHPSPACWENRAQSG